MNIKKNYREPLSWRTTRINKKAEKLILGSFTSSGGMDNYYYCSDSNDFYYCLDYALFLNEDDVDLSQEANIIKEQILTNTKTIFVKLRNELCKSNQKNALRESVHDKLLNRGIDICDLFESVYMKDPNKSDDSNIALSSPYTKYAEDCLLSINDSNVNTVYCTSKYVMTKFIQFKKKHQIKDVKIVPLASPSRNARIKLSNKIKIWSDCLK